MKKPPTLQKMNISMLGLGLVIAVGVVRFAEPAISATLTPGATQKLTVYGGVMTVNHTTTGGSLFEIGNNGQDIASTSDIYLRPNTSNGGTRFSRNSDLVTQDMTLTGKLIIRNGKQLCIGNPMNCASSWASGTGDGWAVNGAPQYLRPATTGTGVVSTRYLNVYGNDASNSTVLFKNSDPNGVAADFSNGSHTATQYVHVYDSLEAPSLKNNGYDTWTRDNDGVNSGLDADRLDGVDMSYGSYLSGECSDEMCFCRQKDGNFGCIEMFDFPYSGP